MKVLIIGGGASGMAAALSAARDPANSVTLLERQARVGRKLLATGNGRCNLTNRELGPEHYHGEQPEFALPALRAWGVEATLAEFRRLGLVTVTEPGGRVYPFSDQANSVVDVLRFALDAAGVTVVCGCEVCEVKKKARGYQARAVTGESYYGDRLIVAAGGCAGRKLGGTEAGYVLLKMLGHDCTPLRPSLVQIRTQTELVRALKGVRADGRIVLKRDGHVVCAAEGELQFTEFGVSGPAAFELSRAVSTGDGEQTLLIDFCRDMPETELTALLSERCARFPKLAAEELLTGLLQSRLGKTLVRRAGLDAEKPLEAVTAAERLAVGRLVKCCAVEAVGVLGMDSAQVTAGGIRTAQFRADTLESRVAPGIFACGEVLDIDGDCGGYNLQWAWSSGTVAGRLGKTGEETL